VTRVSSIFSQMLQLFSRTEFRSVLSGSVVRCDEIIFLYKAARDGNLDLFLRRIEVWDEEQKRVLVFLTNHRGFAASTIAAIYRQRGKSSCSSKP